MSFSFLFYIFSLQLAGGLLTGKYKFDDADSMQPRGRFFAHENNEDWQSQRTGQ